MSQFKGMIDTAMLRQLQAVTRLDASAAGKEAPHSGLSEMRERISEKRSHAIARGVQAGVLSPSPARQMEAGRLHAPATPSVEADGQQRSRQSGAALG